MKSVALINTVKSVSNTFEGQLRANVSQEIKVYDLLDEFLVKNTNEVGEFTITNKNRLILDLKVQELTGADLIVTTCSTLTPHLDQLRPLISVPVIAIDDAMTKKAVDIASKIFVLATSKSTIDATCGKILQDAEAIGKAVEIDSAVYTEAFEAIQASDVEMHDKIILEESKKISGYDCIVLAQASMAHLEDKIQEISNTTVLSSPSLCIEQVDRMLGRLDL